jgi:hypothetical protein
MSGSVSDAALKDALKQRRKYIEANLECVFSRSLINGFLVDLVDC